MPVAYFLTAMLFILFDIEMVFLYPFAVAAGSLGIFGAVEIVLFIVTLGCTYAYVWRRAGWTGTDQESGGEAFQRDPADRCGEAVNCTWKSSRWPATFGLGAPSVATTRRTRQCAGGSEGRRWARGGGLASEEGADSAARTNDLDTDEDGATLTSAGSRRGRQDSTRVP
jgi:hypothetical protein